MEFASQQDLIKYLSIGDNDVRTEKIFLPGLEGLFNPVPAKASMQKKEIKIPEFKIPGKSLKWKADLLADIIATTEGICGLEWECNSDTVTVSTSTGLVQVKPSNDDSFDSLSSLIKLVLVSRGGLQRLEWKLQDPFVLLTYQPLFFA